MRGDRIRTCAVPQAPPGMLRTRSGPHSRQPPALSHSATPHHAPLRLSGMKMHRLFPVFHPRGWRHGAALFPQPSLQGQSAFSPDALQRVFPRASAPHGHRARAAPGTEKHPVRHVITGMATAPDIVLMIVIAGSSISEGGIVRAVFGFIGLGPLRRPPSGIKQHEPCIIGISCYIDNALRRLRRNLTAETRLILPFHAAWLAPGISRADPLAHRDMDWRKKTSLQ